MAEFAEDPELRELTDHMSLQLLPQVRAEAWKVYQRAPHALELDELEALGRLGLAQAASMWQHYCFRRKFDAHRTEYLAAYLLRRIRGSMLDALRSQDWVTRSARTKAKRLREAGQDLGKSEDELAEATGLTVQEIRETAAVVASRPVSFEAEPHDIPDHTDVEGQAVVSSVLQAATAVVKSQPPQAQVVIALHYYHNLAFPEIAAILGAKEEEVVLYHQETILAVHNAMMRTVL